MISPFFGEFLLHPSPLEYSGNSCSHNCCYCFSNIRNACIKSEFKSTLNLLKKFKENNTYVKSLLNCGYSICISNRTDPFSKSNFIETKSLLKYFANLENGIFFQTKLGNGIEDAIDILKDKKNITFYITITTLNDEISKRIEPGAPVASERIKKALYLKKMGYFVIIAYNPLNEYWMSYEDVINTSKMFKENGINHFILQALHSSKKDIDGFSNDRKKRFEKEILQDIIDKKKEPQYYVQKCVIDLINIGCNALSFGMPFKTDFFNELNKNLGKTFESNYTFFNDCFKNGKNIFSFEDYCNSIIKSDFFDKEFKGLDAYILRVARQVWKGNLKVQNIKTLREVLNTYWNDKRISGSPQNNFLFSKVVDKNNIPILDKNGNISLYFNGKIRSDKYYIV